jgi:hypothetical protein
MESRSPPRPGHLAPVGPDPMEAAEDALEGMGWAFNRRSESLITFGVECQGTRWACAFFWDADLAALRFIARFEDIVIPPSRGARAAEAVAALNAGLPLGHFRLEDDEDRVVPAFVHSLLLGGVAPRAGRGHVRTLLAYAFRRCEDAAPAFALLAKRGGRLPSVKALALALARPAGRA